MDAHLPYFSSGLGLGAGDFIFDLAAGPTASFRSRSATLPRRDRDPTATSSAPGSIDWEVRRLRRVSGWLHYILSTSFTLLGVPRGKPRPSCQSPVAHAHPGGGRQALAAETKAIDEALDLLHGVIRKPRAPTRVRESSVRGCWGPPNLPPQSRSPYSLPFPTADGPLVPFQTLPFSLLFSRANYIRGHTCPCQIAPGARRRPAHREP